MVGKVLFALVLLMVIAVVLARSKRPPAGARSAAREGAGEAAPQPNIARQTAYIFIAIILVTSAVGMVWQWQDRQHEVTVAVIDTRTGQTVEYRSRANLVEDRRFETLDGRKIQVAENERIEVRK